MRRFQVAAVVRELSTPITLGLVASGSVMLARVALDATRPAGRC